MNGGCAVSDRGRAAVYAAEDAAFGGTDLDAQLTSGRLVALARTVTAGEWWQACGAPTVEVVPARASAASSTASSTATPGHVVVRVAGAQHTASTVAHELAHALAGVANGHDARFRAAHVDVVAVLGGVELAADLRRAYAVFGVPAGERSWPAPVRARGDGFVWC